MSRTQINLDADESNWWDFRNDAIRLLNETQATGDEAMLRRAGVCALIGIADALGCVLEAITVDDEDDSRNAGIRGFSLGGSDS